MIQILLLTLLVVVLIVATVVALFFFKAKKTLSSSIGMAEVMSVLPEFDPVFEPCQREKFHHQSRLSEDCKHLQNLDFSHRGSFEYQQGLAKSVIDLWQHPRGINVMIYESMTADMLVPAYVIDLCVPYRDGTSHTLTTAKEATSLPRAAKHKIECIEGATMATLLSMVKPLFRKPIRAVELPDYVEESLIESAAYCWRPEALASKQFNQLIAPMGVQIDEEQAVALAQIGESLRQEARAERILDELGLDSEDHVCVHKYTPRAWAQQLLTDLGAAPNTLRSTMATLQDLPVNQMLAQAVKSVGLQNKVTLVTEVDDARVYRVQWG